MYQIQKKNNKKPNYFPIPCSYLTHPFYIYFPSSLQAAGNFILSFIERKEKEIQAHLVVVTLLMTVIFADDFTLPRGIDPDSSNNGMMLLLIENSIPCKCTRYVFL